MGGQVTSCWRASALLASSSCLPAGITERSSLSLSLSVARPIASQRRRRAVCRLPLPPSSPTFLGNTPSWSPPLSFSWPIKKGRLWLLAKYHVAQPTNENTKEEEEEALTEQHNDRWSKILVPLPRTKKSKSEAQSFLIAEGLGSRKRDSKEKDGNIGNTHMFGNGKSSLIRL